MLVLQMKKAPRLHAAKKAAGAERGGAESPVVKSGSVADRMIKVYRSAAAM
jgi:hypothetical protein